MIVPVMAISNLVLTQQIYSEETKGAHAPCRQPVPLKQAYIDKTLTTTKFILDHIQISDTVVSVKGLNPGVSCIYRTS